MCCYNHSRPGRYAEYCYQATAKWGNSESQFNPSRWQITEVPQTNSNVPRQNNHLTTPANAVRNYRTVPIQLDHSIHTVLIQIQGVKRTFILVMVPAVAFCSLVLLTNRRRTDFVPFGECTKIGFIGIKETTKS